jgi:hypothetical protein
MSQPVDSP